MNVECSGFHVELALVILVFGRAFLTCDAGRDSDWTSPADENRPFSLLFFLANSQAFSLPFQQDSLQPEQVHSPHIQTETMCVGFRRRSFSKPTVVLDAQHVLSLIHI